MSEKRYLPFASCVLSLTTPFLEEFSLPAKKFGYNDKIEILETDICNLLPAYYCLQALSYKSFFFRIVPVLQWIFSFTSSFLFADVLHVFFLADFVPLSVCGLLIRRSRDCERFDIKTRKINTLRNIFTKNNI